MLSEIAEALSEVGPRPSCSAAERALGTLLEARFSAFCDEVRAEPFSCHPHAFLGFIPFVSIVTLAALGLLPVVPWLAAVLGAAAAFVTVTELLRYRELVDPLFPRREGVNIVGVIRPTGPVRRRVVLSAHQDSAWEFNLWYWFKQLGVPVNVLGLAAPLLPAIVGTLAAVGLLPAAGLPAATVAGAVLAPFVAIHLVFHTFRPVPGAMDDLAGLAVITEVGRHFAAHRPASTEVVLLAAAAEECGLRGAKRFVAAHRAELRATPTSDINVDGVYDERFLAVVTWELTTGARSDPALVQLALAAAHRAGHPMRRAIIPLGATDATAFAHAGIPSVGLLCQDTHRLPRNYHTRHDTLDHVRPEALAATCRVVVDMIGHLEADNRGLPNA